MIQKKNKIIKSAAAAGGLALILSIGIITALFKDGDELKNYFSVGNAAVYLDEGNFKQDKIIYPGNEVEKAPSLKNTGTIDEFVFMEVTVPREKIAVLASPTDAPGIKTMQNIFETSSAAANRGYANDETDVQYNIGGDGGGWVFLERTPSDTADSGKTAKEYKYIFGYSKKLAKNESTITLFDKVSLKNFIDDEIEGGKEYSIGIKGLCIQANELDGYSVGAVPTQAQLLQLYNVCQNKKS